MSPWTTGRDTDHGSDMYKGTFAVKRLGSSAHINHGGLSSVVEYNPPLRPACVRGGSPSPTRIAYLLALATTRARSYICIINGAQSTYCMYSTPSFATQPSPSLFINKARSDMNMRGAADGTSGVLPKARGLCLSYTNSGSEAREGVCAIHPFDVHGEQVSCIRYLAL
jgi:hypothetical protein